MTLTVRSSSLTGATTAARALTHAEMDANWAHVIESSNQNFTPSGSGAVARAVQEALRDIHYNVKGYGAVGDGTTDDTDAIQAAFDAASAGQIVYFPLGTYLVSDSLTLTKSLRIMGARHFTAGSRIKCAAGFPADYVLSFEGTSAAIIRDADVYGISFDGSSVAGVLGAIYCKAVRTSHFQFLYAQNFADGAFLTMESPSGTGAGTTLNTIINPSVVNCFKGIRFLGAGASDFCTRNTIMGGNIAGKGSGVSGGIGIEIGDASNTVVDTIGIFGTNVGSFEIGIDVHGDFSRLDCWTEGNGTGCVINSTAGSTVFLGPSFVDGLTNNGANAIGFLADGRHFMSRPTTPSALSSGDNNNYAFTTGFHVLRLQANAAGSTITGIAGGYNGAEISIVNISANNLTVANASTNSDEGNRILSGTGADIVLGQNDMITLWYDQSTPRWRVKSVVT
jgi:hypothetical protein